VAKVDARFRVAVLGPGAIGGFLAALFWKKGYDVSCIGKKASVVQIARDGIYLKSRFFGDLIAHPKAHTKLNEQVDVLFITVKAPFLVNAIDRIDINCIKNSVIVPLLNGVGHCEIIRSQLGARIAVGTIGLVEAKINRKGIICHLSNNKPHIDIASASDISEELQKKIINAVKLAGISISVLGTEKEVIWSKLVRLNAIASLTAAFQKTIGTIRSDTELRLLLKEIVEEGVLVAGFEGVQIEPEEIVRQIDLLPKTLKTSLQWDIQRGKSSELDAITGGVIKLAKIYGVSLPAHKHVYRLIKERLASFG